MLSPLPASKWDYTKAAHLCNRAGFGATPAEITRIARLKPLDAVAYFVDYQNIPEDFPRPDWAQPDPERVERYMEIQRMAREEKNSDQTEDQKREMAEKRQLKIRELRKQQAVHLEQMRVDWLKRMATGPRPLQEKLTLFWHGHFATSAIKVQDAYFMWLQIDTFRQKGNGNWLDLLEAVATDPAMLVWLDQAQSRKEHPNENFAREVMELFSLGEGHYTEKDVTESARAMTGWSLDRPNEEYIYRPRFHDNGIKTIFGNTGDFNGRQVLQLIAAQPQSARFITTKLWKYFASDDPPTPRMVEAMAQAFHDGDDNIGGFLRTLFSSEEFYADSVMHNQIKSPVQWLVNSVRLLEREMPPPLVATQMTKTLGQDLLAPPNVKGWDGGVSWISTNTLLDRYNQAAILVMGQGKLGATGDRPGQKMIAARANELGRNMRPCDVSKILPEDERHDGPAIIAKLEKWFIQGRLTDKHREVLRDYLQTRDDLDDQDIRHAIRLLMSTPEYQLT